MKYKLWVNYKIFEYDTAQARLQAIKEIEKLKDGTAYVVLPDVN